MSMEFPLSQSPRTQFQMAPVEDDANDLFAKGFTDLAYKALTKTVPEILPNVISFKIIEVNADEAKGIGAFIVANQTDIIFIPCLVSENSVKPMDMFYSRTSDRFFPLNNEWLNYSIRNDLGSLGTAVKTPTTLQTDVDIRNLIVPPTTGRYSYAEEDVKAVFIKSASLSSPPETLSFLAFLNKAPNSVKLAAKSFFAKNTKLLKRAAEVYSAKKLKEALQTKQAEVRKEVPMKKDLFLFVPGSPVEELQKRLGKDAGSAYKALRYYGFYAHDMRKDIKDVAKTPEVNINFVQPDKSGLYNVYFNDGSYQKAIIIVKPVLVELNKTDAEKMRYKDTRNHPADLKPNARYNYLVVTEDGKGTCLYDIIAEPLITASFEEVTDFVNKLLGPTPKSGDRGCYISTGRLDLKSTEIVYVSKVSDNKGVERVTCDTGDIVINHHTKNNNVFKPIGEPMLVLGDDFKWLPVKDRIDPITILKNSLTIQRLLDEALINNGATKIACLKTMGKEFKIANERDSYPTLKAIEKLATHYNISVPNAIRILNARLKNEKTAFYVTKKADDSAMMQAVQERQVELQNELSVLQNLISRTQELMGASAPEQVAPAQVDPAQMQGQMDPAQMQQMQQMDPAQMQGQIDPAQMQGQMDPAQMQQMQGQMDPAQMQQMQGQMDPAQMQQMQGQMQPQMPPPPMLRGELNPELIGQQINPQFMQDAADLNENDIFDVASIASMAQQPGLKDLMQVYMPTLEKALDNLGRSLLLLEIKESDIKQRSGNQNYLDVEMKLRNTFRNLGESIIQINKITELDQVNIKQY